MGFRTAKRLNAQFTFYLHVDLPLSYTTHLLDPIEPLGYPLISLHQYLFAKTGWNKDKLPVTINFLKITAAHRS